ncbi:MAG: phosphodiester glycosidase family protein [Chitinophagaceae bacterium]|nr:phosphodiester glycosidase family protein [Chitinophagaceae bacterium]
MYKLKLVSFLIIAILLSAGIIVQVHAPTDDDDFVSYQADLLKSSIKFYWKDDKGQPLKSIQALKTLLEGKGEKLLFAMNGGMYKTDHSPLGLFIQEHKQLVPMNTAEGSGNFYLHPNGIFYITTGNRPAICHSNQFINRGDIEYATQSGPMLLTNGVIHPAFKKGSTNINIRNGVGILPGNQVLFVMSKKKISLYDFANYFKKEGCSNALYLDGFVSRTYLPAKNWLQTDGDFGVMIGASVKQ